MDKTGDQDFIKDANLNIIMISDYNSMKKHPAEKLRSRFDDETCLKASCFDAGFIASKYLYILPVKWIEINCESLCRR